jgi:hypothetical protein
MPPQFKHTSSDIQILKNEYYAKYHPTEPVANLTYIFSSVVNSSYNSCGLTEISASSFYTQCIKFPTDRLRIFENMLICTGLNRAGIIFTVADIPKQKEFFDQILGPGKDLGLNRNHSPWNQMWGWITSIDEIEKHIEDEKLKIEEAAKKEADKLSSADKITPPKPRSIKRRAASNAIQVGDPAWFNNRD